MGLKINDEKIKIKNKWVWCHSKMFSKKTKVLEIITGIYLFIYRMLIQKSVLGCLREVGSVFLVQKVNSIVSQWPTVLSDWLS